MVNDRLHTKPVQVIVTFEPVNKIIKSKYSNKATEQYFHVALFAIQMKAVVVYSTVVLFIMLYKVPLFF